MARVSPSPRSLSALLAPLVLVACSGTSGSPQPPPGQTSDAIVVGLVNTENAPVGSFPDVRRGALAAVRQVDAAGGVKGRQIRLETCTTNGTPESSLACANQLLAKKPVAVIGGVDLGAAASLQALASANVPYVGGTPVTTEALTSRSSFMFTGGTATEVLGEVAYATDTLHVQRLAAVYADVPGLLSTAVGLLGTIVRKKGVSSFKLVPVASDAPDVAPALSAAAAAKPDAVLAVFPGQTCTRVIQGVGAVGLRARMMYPSLCASASALAAGGSTIDGSVIATGYRPFTDTADKDVATYLAALRRYDSSLKPSLLSQAGFSVVMNLAQLLGEAAAPTAAGLLAQLRSARNHPNFMAAPFTCDAKRIPLLGGLCNASVQISVVRGGAVQPVGGWVDTAPVARLVAG
jgi:branched-chain amino acid transport system substrate-binding protein